ncbi:MAG TPA: HlyD family efflux transporter periplasmic adaptor subunit [Terriglobia bacterium]|nr:HlyD family efflux transporter periplasmic adaptor subunit [Terriglobia bacterium]
MDIPRKLDLRKRRLRRIGLALAGIVVVLATTLGLARLKPAPPQVDRSTVWIDTVKRGPMDIQVRGLGKLVPEQVLWVPAQVDGRVAQKLVLPGIAVQPDTVLLKLTSPAIEQAALDAKWQLKAAEADYNSLKAQLNSQLLDQRGAAATAKSDYLQAKLQAERDKQLASFGLGPDLTAQLSASKAQSAQSQDQIATQQIGVLSSSIQAQLAAQEAKIEQLRALYNLKEGQLESLTVRAGAAGVLQELPVEAGQQVTAGATLAKVVQPNHLKAQLQIAETQAKDLQLNQQAEIDTHNGVIPGHVIRIDPSVQNGTRTVDVKLDGPLPPGAVPDLSVDGTIEIEHLSNVVYVGRPAFGQSDSTVGLFKLNDGGNEALRLKVKLGLASVNTVQILSGLKVGDQVILSDMSRWDGFDRIRLE